MNIRRPTYHDKAIYNHSHARIENPLAGFTDSYSGRTIQSIT